MTGPAGDGLFVLLNSNYLLLKTTNKQKTSPLFPPEELPVPALNGQLLMGTKSDVFQDDYRQVRLGSGRASPSIRGHCSH